MNRLMGSSLCGRVSVMVVLACVCVAAAWPLCAEAAGPNARVEARGVRVVGPAYGDEMGGLRAFNWSQGVSLAVLVEMPEGGLIAFDDDKSKLVALTDDKGASLLKGEEFHEGFGMMTSISDDGKACLVEINGQGLPGKDASRIRAAGTMVFRCGSTKKTFQDANVAVKVGAKVNAGAVPFEITEVGKPDWGDEPLQIKLTTHQEIPEIAEIKFLDNAGREIESSQAGTMTTTMFNKVTVERYFNLSRKTDSLAVAITYWTDMKTVSVPFSVEAGLGL